MKDEQGQQKKRTLKVEPVMEFISIVILRTTYMYRFIQKYYLTAVEKGTARTTNWVMKEVNNDQEFEDLWRSPELYWMPYSEEEERNKIWGQVFILKSKETPYRRELDTFPNSAEFIVSYSGIEHQYYDILKYDKANFAIHSSGYNNDDEASGLAQ